ncbi:GNAT family N-acetyltransferase [Lactiplantibacillus songbeiensis]|uniref:GNAT family N-acetyltransferase n=1 Tax=Lactiplantibacillus songbeiensis TaxID=2559920 RepID=A0ABW4C448_9LACO|nr:GNAT family N-acetyltransferase [Lactiplantibacillus songbeiensis]
MFIRKYMSTDFPAIRALFKHTIRVTNARDYSAEQLAAWIGNDDQVTLTAWQQSLLAHVTLVAIQDEQLVGFADMSDAGYLDRLYVQPAYQRQGVATALVDGLIAAVSVKTYTTAASITARPFFERQNFRVIHAQQVERDGCQLTNYLMVRGV